VLIGTGAMSGAHQAGRSVPSDLSVVAIQDSWAVDFTTPRMTTVALPLRELGGSAVRTLIRYIRGEDVQASETIGTAPQIRPRDSVAPPPEAVPGHA
jgi:LacI family transcriptional regulator